MSRENEDRDCALLVGEIDRVQPRLYLRGRERERERESVCVVCVV